MPALTQFEWYVPIDGDAHIYFQTLGKRVTTPMTSERFGDEFEVALARRSRCMASTTTTCGRARPPSPSTRTSRAGSTSTLFEPDSNILEWRKLASRHNRGVQAPEHLR